MLYVGELLYVGVFLLGSGLGALVMGFMAGVSRNNQCEDCMRSNDWRKG